MKKFLLFFLLILLVGGITEIVGDRISNRKANREIANYKAAVEVGNFDKAYGFLGNYHKDLLSAISQCSPDYVWSDDKENYRAALAAYFDAFDYIYKAEIRLILTTMEGQDAADKIIFLLSEIPIDGKVYSQGNYEMNSTNIEKGEYYTFYNTYITWARHFNGLCDTALKLAINRKNKEVAQQVPLYYADNVIVSHRNGVDYIDYVRTDALEAQKQFEEAVTMGVFK